MRTYASIMPVTAFSFLVIPSLICFSSVNLILFHTILQLTSSHTSSLFLHFNNESHLIPVEWNLLSSTSPSRSHFLLFLFPHSVCIAEIPLYHYSKSFCSAVLFHLPSHPYSCASPSLLPVFSYLFSNLFSLLFSLLLSLIFFL